MCKRHTENRVESILNCSKVLLLACIALFLSGCDFFKDDTKPAGHYIDESYTLAYGKDDKSSFRTYSDRLGVVPSPDQHINAVLKVIKGMGYEIVGEGRESHIVIKLPPVKDKRSYADLRKESAAIAQKAGSAVVWVGPLVETISPAVDVKPNAKEQLIATDVVIVKVREGTDKEKVLDLASSIDLQLLQQNPADKHEYYFAIKPSNDRVNAFNACEKFIQAGFTVYATPNFYVYTDIRLTTPNDRLYPNQWSLNNSGQGGGTVDADIDADWAWDFGFGNANTIVAVLDGGFDMAHLDLTPNLFTNAGDAAGNGIDDDGNTYVDDVNGWDFTGCGAGAAAGCGDNNPTGPDTRAGRHGTMTAGAAVAAGNNTRGVSGSCPNCTLLPLRITMNTASVAHQALAFAYAQNAGADVITNSWGYRLNGVATQPVVNGINNANAAGSVIFFAMFSTGGGYEHDCVNSAPLGVDISALANVIGISASSNADVRTPAGYGNCMELLAPTNNSGAVAGTLWPVSTDMTGAPGYNTANPIGTCASTEFAPPPADDTSYTFCASGTSYATPLAAGVSGLMESVDNTLTPQRHQQVLQDTADKIEPAVAAYNDDTGFSAPTTAPAPIFATGGVGSTHGFGRVNAFEAVRLVAPTAAGGRGDVDVFLRDNRLDWGNTEQPSNVLMDNPRAFIPHYASVSIKIDAAPYEAAAPTTAAQFAAFPDEEPISEATNKVYVLVRNRGRNNASNVTLKVQWAFAGTALPALPSDFWTVFPADSTVASPWNVIGTDTIPTVGYSGASVATQAGDNAVIRSFDFDAPALDPSVPAFRHYCLFAVLNADNDAVLPASRAQLAPDLITPFDNNVTHRNVSLQDPLDSGRSARFAFYVRNPSAIEINTYLRVRHPKGWEWSLSEPDFIKAVKMPPNSEKQVILTIQGKGVGEVLVEQFVKRDHEIVLTHVPKDKKFGSGDLYLGGVIYKFRVKTDKQYKK